MTDSFICWKCGDTLTGLILPMSRREECANCKADQHVCKMCVFFDGISSRGGCNESRAEDVSDKECANFCDYFKLVNVALNTKTIKFHDKQKSDEAKAKFAELFGDPIAEEGNTDKEHTPAELAEKKLRDMLQK